MGDRKGDCKWIGKNRIWERVVKIDWYWPSNKKNMKVLVVFPKTKLYIAISKI